MAAEHRIKQLDRLYLHGVQESNGQALSLECLLDILVVLYDECCNSTLRREKCISDFVEWAKPIVQKVKYNRLHRDDFETLKVIGRGAFGEVAVVKMKNTESAFAMKILNKWEMLKRAETACFQEERDVLVYGDSRWITNLHYAFQDDEYLYLVMDYYSGGDLLTLLSKFEDRLPEEMAKFYVAEMILAIDSIHQLRYVHRDIKPDNVLLDQYGHVRLADFGSCLKVQEDGTVQSNVAVGTPDYISPEILRAMEDGKGRYGAECDWWSLGVCMYEMLFGETPFYAESLVETYGKIMNHKTRFDFPTDIDDVSDDAKDLIRKLICSSEHRLGQNGLDDFKNHPWFEGIEWDNIRDMVPPYIPEVSSPTDTSNFDVDDNDFRQSESVPPTSHAAFNGNHLPFVGFTFTRDSPLSDLGSLVNAKTVDMENDSIGTLAVEAYERRIKRLESEKSELSRKLTDTTRALQHQLSTGGGSSMEAPPGGIITGSGAAEAEIRRLRDEVVMFKKKLQESHSEAKHMERDLKEVLAIKKELESREGDKLKSDSRIKSLEKDNKRLKMEREDTQRDFEQLHERYKSQTKELKEAHSQRKLAMQEFTDISDRLSELRSQKQKLSRLVREKEEEVEEAMQRVDVMRQDLRRTEKSRKEYEVQMEQIMSEVSKEKKLRERSEQYSKQLEDENEIMKKRALGRTPSSSGLDKQQEIAKLKATMEKKDVMYEESLVKEKTRHSKEINGLREQLQDSESQIHSLRKDLHATKEKLESARKASLMEHDDKYSDLKRKYERDIIKEQEENRKLQAELDRANLEADRLIRSHRQVEEEMRELSDKKDSVAHWEAQISEIIQWVSDEKDARGYLQALATKMTEELEGLKVTGMVGATREKDWKMRRSQKLDKIELLNLQSSLQSEIQAKQSVAEELKKVKVTLVAAESKLVATESRNREYESEIEKLKQEIAELNRKVDAESPTRPNSQMSYMDSFLINEPSRSMEFAESDDEEDMDGEEQKPRDEKQVDVWYEEPRPTPPRKESIGSEEDEIKKKLPPPPPPPVQHVYPAHKPTFVQPKPKAHQFVVRTFGTPVKCNHCTSLMTGQVRQGTVCEVCHFACHVACAEKAPPVCPIPADQTKRPLGIDPTRGIGTAYEGFLKIPKPGGVRKGWTRQFAVVCDFKLFLYETPEGKNAQPTTFLSHVIDMRDEDFGVSSVLASDVIHANKNHIPCIFRVTASQLNPPGLRAQILLLADSEQDRIKWVGALTELRKVLVKNKLPDRSVYRAKEVYDSSLPLIRVAQCAAIVDPDRFLLGTDEGMFGIDLAKDEILRVGDGKKAYQIEVLHDEQLVVVISGKGRHVRLFSMTALEGYEMEGIKLQETKGCTLFAIGTVRQGSTTCICAAVKRHVFVYELNRTKIRHRKIKDIALPNNAQWLGVFGGRLIAGFMSGYGIFSIQGEGYPHPLISAEDPSFKFICTSPVEAMCAVEVNAKEFLLCFSTVGVYADIQGRRSRHQELMWPSPPSHICYVKPYLTVYSETAVDVIDVNTMEWLQTIPIKQTRPLSTEGSMNVSLVTEGYVPRLIFFKNILCDGASVDLRIPDMPYKRNAQRLQSKRRFSFKTREDDRMARKVIDRKSLISGPTNFNHISHMGPGDGLQILKDLPVSMTASDMLGDIQEEGAVRPTDESQRRELDRVKSMFQPPVTANRGGSAQHRRPISSISASSSATGNINGNPRDSPGGSPRRGGGPPSDGSTTSSQDSYQKNFSLAEDDKDSALDLSSQSPRHSIASNNSSMSSPPTPHRTSYVEPDQGSAGSFGWES
ncbi:serine/threonine-protein kinase MRCK alpha-like isoform X2 [Ptychodera flava]|uniref:serine/threonine-protein kinase MRCK alpha-like isoform X2 n=1 Tax=Ptychodera flava TaxID=63121 RepID=UPI00396A7887